ncbi:hypothetical protein [Streptomyces sp. NBC_01180]|uniref:hypothetical protein n=1 Tax=Streptomyces sp. NBC_01180 TaxID=2903763 RepID=UPI0038679470|nr:hypothetical protein OG708_08985 [Streptomyces sp. NBC_01180]
MSKRGTVCDYFGEELYAGDLIAYSARQGNMVRMADAIVLRVTAKLIAGRLRPMLLVQPTGAESGFVRRRTMRSTWIAAEHVRLITPDYEGYAQ